MTYRTHYERIETIGKYEALHRLVSDAIGIAPPAERPMLRAYEAELLDRWQEASTIRVRYQRDIEDEAA